MSKNIKEKIRAITDKYCFHESIANADEAFDALFSQELRELADEVEAKMETEGQAAGDLIRQRAEELSK